MPSQYGILQPSPHVQPSSPYCITSSQPPGQQMIASYSPAPSRFYVTQDGYDTSYPHQHNPQLHPQQIPVGFPMNFSSCVTRFAQPGSMTSGYSNGMSQSQQSSCFTDALSNRPTTFEPHCVNFLQQAEIDSSRLIEEYLSCGGQQWAESIDPDLTVAVIKYCMDSSIIGAILVFLPGYDDILTVRESVLKELESCRTKPVIFTLHSQMQSQDQQKVFGPVQPGFRKVILSTNIAEASLTIDDVVFVIDCGKVKEKTYDHSTRISQLKVAWISKSNAEQRSGRAGRCQDGYCFRLYSTEDYDRMYPTQIAEMKRAAIHDVCLHAKMFAPDSMSVKKFLSLAPEPPAPQAVERSLEFLEELGALYSDNPSVFEGRSMVSVNPREPELTELGRHIAQLPLEPQLARLLLFGIALKCFDPVVTLVAALSHRDPFILPLGDERIAALVARDEFGRRDFSDHLMLLRAFYAYNRVSVNKQWHFCRSKFLSPNTMKMIQGIRTQLLVELRRLHILPPSSRALDDPDLNRYSDSWPMVQGAIVAGCYPGIGFVRAGNKLRKIRTSTESSATLHPSCVIKRQVLAPAKRSDAVNQYSGEDDVDPTIEYLAFQELSQIEETLTLRTVTAVPPLAVVLFAGAICTKKDIVDRFGLAEELFEESPNEELEPGEDGEGHKYLELEPWLAFRGKRTDLQLILKLRFKLMSYFLNVMKNPRRPITEEDEAVLDTVSRLLSSDHQRHGFVKCSDLPVHRSSCRPVKIDLSSSEVISSMVTNNSQYSVSHVNNSGYVEGPYSTRQQQVATTSCDVRLDQNGAAGLSSHFRTSISTGNFKHASNQTGEAIESYAPHSGSPPRTTVTHSEQRRGTVVYNSQNRHCWESQQRVRNSNDSEADSGRIEKEWDRRREKPSSSSYQPSRRQRHNGQYDYRGETSGHCRSGGDLLDEEQVPEDPCVSTSTANDLAQPENIHQSTEENVMPSNDGNDRCPRSSDDGVRESGSFITRGHDRGSSRRTALPWKNRIREFTRRNPPSYVQPNCNFNSEHPRAGRVTRNSVLRSNRNNDDNFQRREQGTGVTSDGKRRHEAGFRNPKVTSIRGGRSGTFRRRQRQDDAVTQTTN
ncbi:hypothetical protein AB6A40_005231 [Gnathostoma spinigerum]|uniref:Helicase C-terminal domain-containing protein n=1 Tax=Gnathostoma spinigerum TaxID=75299 RepID=A0ABD6EH22_9BILA